MKITNLSGGDFEITYTNCDTLAKEEFVSVYVSKAGGNKTSLFARWLNKRTLLFQYDPGMWNSPLPLVRASGQNRILISIPKVSSVIFQSRSWENFPVDYEIGHIDYPGGRISQRAQ
jgi:hypothetical protein